jgi:NIMA (never in mitosis gene a)-related kinase
MAVDNGVPGRNYTKIKEIGKGSYGKCALVQDREGKNFVMKVIDMARMDTKQRKDAINEVKVLSSLKHPYIISYRESFTEGKSLAIVMDYAEGGDLHQRIQHMRRGGKCFPEERVLRWFTEATLALKYLHDRHILHRDLKTSNLFLTAQDRLRVGDFGISKALESTVAFARTTIGTPYYLSPEICMERPYSFSSDIWALGCVLFELAALRVPFDAQSLQALVQKITRGTPPSIPSTYSADLSQLGRDLLHRDPSQRPGAPEILQRPFIQQEIRNMLREEQAKVAAKCESQSARAAVTPLKPYNRSPSEIDSDYAIGPMPMSARKPQQPMPPAIGLPLSRRGSR